MKSQHPSFTLAEGDMLYFGKIPSSFLKPILLLHHEKMNYREIAVQTGLPLGTVKSRIFRAREMIRKLRADNDTDASASD